MVCGLVSKSRADCGATYVYAGKWGFARLRRHALMAGWADDEEEEDMDASTSNAAAGGAATNGGGSRNGSGGLLSLGLWRRNWKRAAYTALERAESIMRLAWCVAFFVIIVFVD